MPQPPRSAPPSPLPTPEPPPSSPEITRRRLLALAGGAGLVAVAAACGGGSSDEATGSGSGGRAGTGSSPSTTATTAPTTATSAANAVPVQCVLTPETTEGPYYLDGPERRDVTEGRSGTPLRLQLTVAEATRCMPISGAVVEIWHSDAQGVYSGFGEATSDRTFLRGSQVTDANGVATFDTIYPGWYPGRATHIHMKARQSKGASQVHTGQMFFDESVNDAVYAAGGAYARQGRRTTNAQDGIFRGGGEQSMVVLTKSGDGYVGTMVIGIRDTV